MIEQIRLKRIHKANDRIIICQLIKRRRDLRKVNYRDLARATSTQVLYEFILQGNNLLQLIISEQQCYYGCVQASRYRKFAKLHVVRCKMLELFKMAWIALRNVNRLEVTLNLWQTMLLIKKRLRPGNKEIKMVNFSVTVFSPHFDDDGTCSQTVINVQSLHHLHLRLLLVLLPPQLYCTYIYIFLYMSLPCTT